MIGYLKGRVVENADGKLILGITTGAGATESVLGYAVTVPNGSAYLGFLPGKVIELFVHTHVREDQLDLFGFANREEKDLFLTLVSVNGIGPKVAMGILSHVEASGLVQAILDGDRDTLTKIPGIGKKTAERVVLELSDPLRKKAEAGAFAGWSKPAKPGTTVPAGGATNAAIERIAFVRDAREALVGLGYREADVVSLLKRVMEDTPAPKNTEEAIRAALRRMNAGPSLGA